MDAKFRSVSVLLASLLALTSLIARTARADTYSGYIAAYTDRGFFVAEDDFGDWSIIVGSALCGNETGELCYETYYQSSGEMVYTTTIPTLLTDPNPPPGTGCAPTTGDYLLVLCNNGHPAYFIPKGEDIPTGLYSGISMSDRIYNGSFDGGVMMPNGTFYFIDGYANTLNVELDLTSLATAPTPEPSSLILFGSSILAIIAASLGRFHKRA